ncbi:MULTISPECIES: holin family protein [Bacillus]|uniref:phage holin family protein n=1 Tax=Bacillus TaxID=1386 RepID=UPI001BED212C|nr:MULTISPECIES: holin family protein [Bacillus]MBT2624030.1 holin family protein [Bacillus sp. ISL-32]MCI3197970.1 holin family protein [Bacillus sp. HU-1818]MCY8514547.1 holin family protein [Bacillus atrophaeus]MCY8517574.1 holin family protein [Bacillus atrophaeus]MCY8858899.1 holin family protein [Bacillus atrophaeus]
MDRDFGIFSFFAVSVSAAGFFFGGFQYSFLILLSLMAIEFISTTLKESILRKLALRNVFARLVKKIVTLSLISVCHFFDQLMKTEGSMRDLAIMFYILYESVQIVITASSLGVPVPQMLIDLLDTLKNKFRRKP